MEIFIGLDQSINSTGVTIQKFENNQLVKENFYIITGKVSKKALSISQSLNNFDYILYNKLEKSDSKNNNEFEFFKLMNIVSITDIILDLIDHSYESSLDKIYIAMEGISYSSSQTKSLIDLSGLSYVLRYRINNFFKSHQDQCGGLYIFTPGEIKKFATGNGNANKDMMVNLFKNLKNDLKVLPKIDDIADSFWICAYIQNIHTDILL